MDVVDMVNPPIFIGFHTSHVVAGFQPSTVGGIFPKLACGKVRCIDTIEGNTANT